MSTEMLFVRDIIGSDPLAWLFQRWRMSPMRLASIFFAAGLVYLVGLAAAFGYFWPRPGIVASQSDVFNQLNFLIIFPTAAFYYLWQPVVIQRVYVSIRSLTPDEIEGALWAKIRQINQHPGWWLAGAAFAVLGVVAGTYDNALRLGAWWYAANWLMVAVLQIVRALIFYMLAVIAARHFATVVGLNHCYKEFHIPLMILPTGKSGLRDVGRYAFSFTVLVAVVGLNIGLAPVLSSQMGTDYPIQVLAYCLLAPSAFILPLWQAHSYLARHRDRVLTELAGKHQAEYAQLMELLRSDGMGAAASLERLKVIAQTYELTRKASTWPFSQELLSQLAATSSLPFLFTVLQALIRGFSR